MLVMEESLETIKCHPYANCKGEYKNSPGDLSIVIKLIGGRVRNNMHYLLREKMGWGNSSGLQKC